MRKQAGHIGVIRYPITCVCLSLLFLAGFLRLSHDTPAYGQDALGSKPEDALYEDLPLMHPEHHKFEFVNRGIIECVRKNKPARAVCMHHTGPPASGQGIIGIYDADGKLCDYRTTGDIKFVKGIARKTKQVDTLLVRRLLASGMGEHDEALYILDVDNLWKPLWAGIVVSSFDGPEDIGHLLRRTLLLLDIDNDAEEELVVVKSNQIGRSLKSIVLRRRQVECTVFSFDPQSGTFQVRGGKKPYIVYPTPDEELKDLSAVFAYSSQVQDSSEDRLPPLSLDQQELLYRDLESRHPGHKNLKLCRERIIECVRKNKPVRAVCLSESSPTGEGIIGIYDPHGKLCDYRITHNPIRYIRGIAINKRVDTLLVREQAGGGTGIYRAVVSFLDVEDLANSLWTGEVEHKPLRHSDEHTDQNARDILYGTLVLFDIPKGKQKDLLFLKSRPTETDMRGILFGHIEVECTVFSFDPKSRKFKAQEDRKPRILHPCPADESIIYFRY